jgi:hypothetical protein
MVKVLPPAPDPDNCVVNWLKVAGCVPKSRVPKLIPVCEGEPLIKQPFESVKVAPIVPELVTASALFTDITATPIIRERRIFFMLHLRK